VRFLLDGSAAAAHAFDGICKSKSFDRAIGVAWRAEWKSGDHSSGAGATAMRVGTALAGGGPATDRSAIEIDLQDLFALNVLLQLVDGFLTYQALQFGFSEANPILNGSIATLGCGTALLLFKAQACGLLLLVRRNVPPALGSRVLRCTAVGYVLAAVVPWVGKLLVLAAE
jgi:hypothetical protein